eukprot:Awhi_evm1s4124
MDPEVVAATSNALNKILNELQAHADKQTSKLIALGDKWRAVVGPKFSNLDRIQKLSGAKLNINKDTNDLTIEGEFEQVAIAAEQVNLVLTPPPPESIARFPVNKHQTYVIIGVGGATIKSIQNNTGAVLDLEGEKGDAMRTLVISGSHKEVFDANETVMALLKECGHQEVITASKESISLLLYSDAYQFKALQQDFKRSSIELHREQGTIVITGPKPQVEEIRDRIYSIFSSPPPRPTLKSGEVLEEVELGNAAGAVIGAKYANLKALKSSCRVEVDTPPTLKSLWIWGKPDNVKKAKAEVEAIIKKQGDKEDSARATEEKLNQFAAHQEAAAAASNQETGLPWGGSEPVG